MSKAKHYPAAFINVIWEGKDFNEAIKYLQETWNELQESRERIKELEAARASLPSAQPSDVEHALEIGLGFVEHPSCVGVRLKGKRGIINREKAKEIIEAALTTTQQAQSGDVQKLVEAANNGADRLERLAEQQCIDLGMSEEDCYNANSYYKNCTDDARAIRNVLTPFTQNKGD